MYVRLNGIEIPVIDLEFFCRCPICGREVAVPEFFEYFESGDFDPYDSRIYCDACSEESQKLRAALSGRVPENELDAAVMKTQRTLHSGIVA